MFDFSFFFQFYFKAKSQYEKEEKKREEAKARGEDTWILPSLEKRIETDKQVCVFIHVLS